MRPSFLLPLFRLTDNEELRIYETDFVRGNANGYR